MLFRFFLIGLSRDLLFDCARFALHFNHARIVLQFIARMLKELKPKHLSLNAFFHRFLRIPSRYQSTINQQEQTHKRFNKSLPSLLRHGCLISIFDST